MSELDESTVMAGMTVHEIRDYVDKAFYDALMDMLGEKQFDAVAHLRWLVGHALMYAHSCGLYEKHLKN